MSRVTRTRVRSRKRLVVVALIGGFVALSFLSALLIPLYSYPGVDWNKIVASKLANPGVPMVVIINPDNGPGAHQDQNYVKGVNDMRAAGVVVLGYDHTSYGARSLAEVRADIDSYKSWYALSGIFFDEMSNVPGYEGYYTTLNAYSKSVGFAFTVGNPGANTIASYVGTLDVIVTYENQGVPNTASLEAETMGMPKNNFAVIAYGVNSFDASAVGNVFNYASYVYVTNATLPNPYGALTSDFSKIVDLIASQGHAQTSTSLTVQSASLTGTPIVGLLTELRLANGSIIASGGTPVTHSIPLGAAATVSVGNFGNFVFSHWEDGNTNPTRTVTPTQHTTLTAYYGTVPVETLVYLTVQSVGLTGAPIVGPSTIVKSTNGGVVASGNMPVTHSVVSGAQSIISVSNSDNFVFKHWEDGSTNPTRTLTPTQQTTLTAYYDFTPMQVALTVQSTSLTGAPIAGPLTVKYANGSVIASGNTPLTYSIPSGTAATVSVGNFGKYVFSHWEDGSTNPTRTVTPTQQATLTAYYSTTPVSNPNTGTQTFAITSTTACAPAGSICPTYINTATSTISATIYLVVHDSAGRSVFITSSSLTLAPGQSGTVTLTTSGLHGSYGALIFAVTSIGAPISWATTLSINP